MYVTILYGITLLNVWNKRFYFYFIIIYYFFYVYHGIGTEIKANKHWLNLYNYIYIYKYLISSFNVGISHVSMQHKLQMFV